MSDLDVQLKYKNKNGGHDNIYPKTKSKLIQMDNGKNIETVLSDVEASYQTILDKQDTLLTTLDSRTEFEMKNLVQNGDFSNGTTGWSVASASQSLVNGILEVTPSKIYGGTSTNINIVPSNKTYVYSVAKGVDLQFSIFGQNATNLVTLSEFGVMSAIVTPTLSGINSLRIRRGTTVLDVFYVKKVLAIDLTATFGAGKEPTLAEMDRLMARFPNSWFDGVKPIQTIETLYQEKANKVQEAWITPTLINGWTQNTGATTTYMKDEMGFVHFKGAIRGGTNDTSAFQLPVGYRPLQQGEYIVSAGAYSVVAMVRVDTAGNVKITGTNVNWVSLEAITFRAER